MNGLAVAVFPAEIKSEQVKDIVFIVPITVHNSRIMF